MSGAAAGVCVCVELNVCQMSKFYDHKHSYFFMNEFLSQAFEDSTYSASSLPDSFIQTLRSMSTDSVQTHCYVFKIFSKHWPSSTKFIIISYDYHY